VSEHPLDDIDVSTARNSKRRRGVSQVVNAETFEPWLIGGEVAFLLRWSTSKSKLR
jgi:hypothetical protein